MIATASLHLLLMTILLGSTSTNALQPTTHFAVSPDGTRIAYDVTGSGPVVMLLHGGGQTRRVWHDAGYVTRLATEFTVVTVDLRGNGDSDKPIDKAAYAIDRLTADLVAVADAAGAQRFTLWGFSYGANIGRYLAARSDRVRAMVYIGIPFGPAAEGIFEKTIRDMQAKWIPIIDADRARRLDLSSLSEADRATWKRGTVPLTLAWLSAMLDYPRIEPADMRCPTLWLVGTANAGAFESAKRYRSALGATRVRLELLEGLTHPQELERIDTVFPLELAFTRAHR